MEQPIAIFEPERTGNYTATIISIAIAILALAFLVFFIKKEFSFRQRAYRQLLSLLSFFVMIIALVTAFFSFWAAQKFTPVKVFQHGIVTSFGKADLKNIAKVYVHEDRQRSRLSGAPEGKAIRMLIIEETDQKTHVLSEENYNIDSILQVLSTLKFKE